MTERADTPEGLVSQLVALLDVEQTGTDEYRGMRQPGGAGRVFGGQVIAQGLQAAQRSAEGKVAHSLHAYFMRPGNEALPIDYRVTRDFDGGSFATRRVAAMQDDKPILVMGVSFQRPEEGLHHQAAMPDVPPPESLRSERELRERYAGRIPEQARAHFLRTRPIELRPVEEQDWLNPSPLDPVQHVWFRAIAPLPEDPAMHRAVLAYASDMVLLGSSLLPHGVNWIVSPLQVASLDHALWLHEPFRADEWLLYAAESPWSGHGRGFNRGQIFTRDGRLVASVAQEGLIRVKG